MTDSRYRWVIVAAGGLLGCVAIGGLFSLPVFLQLTLPSFSEVSCPWVCISWPNAGRKMKSNKKIEVRDRLKSFIVSSLCGF
jgi:hypothetical protein